MKSFGAARAWVLAGGTAALTALSAGSLAMSLALFSDQETVPATFSSGTIVLDDAKIDALTLTTSEMVPGDAVTDDVVVENDGSDTLRYAVSATSTNPDAKGVRDVLTLTVRTIDATTPASPCSEFDGSLQFSGALGASTSVFGTAAAGGGNGERELDGGSAETLCFRVTLNSGAGNAYQNATTTTTFTFDAEQTGNNP